MPTILAISPHLDDAVFSVGGALAEHAREGWRVIVATVFTQSVPDPKGFALACQLDKGLPADIDYMALRRKEDRRACTILGAEPLWLPLPEAPHRGYGSAGELFGPMRLDDMIGEEVCRHLHALIARYDPDQLWGPQAIGAHVDHVVVLEALLSLQRPLKLWSDYPYVARPVVRPSPLSPRLAAQRLEKVVVETGRATLKVEACLAYASQLLFQFGGAGAARTALSEPNRHEELLVFEYGNS